jgi:hypothetical protein
VHEAIPGSIVGRVPAKQPVARSLWQTFERLLLPMIARKTV